MPARFFIAAASFIWMQLHTLLWAPMCCHVHTVQSLWRCVHIPRWRRGVTPQSRRQKRQGKQPWGASYSQQLVTRHALGFLPATALLDDTVGDVLRTPSQERSKRDRGQSGVQTWKSEAEMVLRQQFDS